MQEEAFPKLEQQKAWKALNPAGIHGCVRGCTVELGERNRSLR